jgi:hypothetical protein
MSQIPDVNRELAEVGAMFAVFDALRRKHGRCLRTPCGRRWPHAKACDPED